MADPIEDPFAFIDEEAGTVSPSQLELILSTPFLHDTALPSPPPTEPVPEPEPEPASDLGLGFTEEAPQPEKNNYKVPAQAINVAKDKGKEQVAVKESGSARKRSEPEPEPAAAPRSSMDLLEALTLLSGEPDMRYENMDILEIAAMKGIRIDPPRWHRPGGYDRKPKNKQ